MKEEKRTPQNYPLCFVGDIRPEGVALMEVMGLGYANVKILRCRVNNVVAPEGPC